MVDDFFFSPWIISNNAKFTYHHIILQNEFKFPEL